MKILEMTQRKKRLKSKKKRKKSMIKKDQPLFEAVQENYWMLLEILTWLPVKILLRFMCVSKHWKTLISSHYFRKLHREKHTSSPPLLIASYIAYSSYFSPFKENITYLMAFDLERRRFVEKITVPLPSRDFIMRTPPYQSKLLYFARYRTNESYLYNPITRQSFLLPNPSRISTPEFNECKESFYKADYGYIPSKDEYIMLHLVKLPNDKFVCEILNISISNDNFKLHYNQWRTSSEATLKLNGFFKHGVFTNGAFYWLAVNYNPNDPENPKDGCMLSYDVEADKFSTIDYPQDLLFLEARLLDIKSELYLTISPESPVTLVMWKWCFDNKLWSPYWKFDFEKLFGFIRGASYYSFKSEVFIYYLKYLKGFEDQPPDDQVSVEMGELKEIPNSTEVVAVHTNLFTL